MSEQPDRGVTQVRFALTVAVVFAFMAVFGHGVQRWVGIAGVLIWLAIAKVIELKNRVSRRRTPPG